MSSIHPHSRIPRPAASARAGLLFSAVLSLVAAGCSEGSSPLDPDAGVDAGDDGGSDAGQDAGDSGVEAPARFSTDATLYTAVVGSGTQACYSFAAAGTVDCDPSGDGWDLMFEVAGRSWALWTNGGVYGNGEGAAFGPLTEAEAGELLGPDDVPGMFADERGGAFLDARWYAYDALGVHDVSANYRVYVIDTGSARYRFQITSYYADTGASAQLTVRYAPLDGGDTKTIHVDASAGGFGAAHDDPANRYAYLDLDTGELLDLSDEEARSSSTAWDLGFKRFEVISNGGISGPGRVTSAVAVRQDHLYDADGNPSKAAFSQLTQDDADEAFASAIDADALVYGADRGQPVIINDGGESSWFQFEIKGGAPRFFANPAVWWVVRSATGDTFAKLHVVDLDAATHAYSLEMFVAREK